MSKLIVLCAVIVCVTAIMPLDQTPQGEDRKRPLLSLAKSILKEKMKQSEYRLPCNTAPLVYIIELNPDFLEEKFSFHGNSTIMFEVLRPTSTVTLHRSDKMDIDKSATELIDENGDVKKPISQNWNSHNNFYSMKFKSKLKVGNYTLKMSWTGRDGKDDWYSPYSGFYRAYDKQEDNKKKYLVTTHFEPIAARQAFPCWDEPGKKAQFEISLIHYPNYTALSNMPVKNHEELSDGKIRTKFERSPKMSPYLPCWIVADYKHIENTHGNITFYGLESSMDSLKYALNASEKAIPALESYTGIPFALPKLDQITVPQYEAKAMEHWGLVSYVTPSVLTRNITLLTDIDEREQIDLVVAHELAHQWFGNLVTPIWWDDLWLNEAFAAYFQYKAIELMFPERHIMEEFVIKQVNRRSFTADKYSNQPRPIKWNPKTKIEIYEMFSGVTYAKGSGVLHMLDHMLGEEVFRDGIRRYLRAHQFTAVNTDDLWDDLQDAYNEKYKDKPLNIKETMDPWIEQTGHPIVTVKRNYETGEVILTQKNARSTNPENKWKIPLNYATKSNPDFSSTLPMMWFNRDEDNVTIPNIKKDDWIIVNIQQRGFYWVDYDEENWRLLANYLDSEDYAKISPINRAQLITDAYRNCENQEMDLMKRLEILINITSYLHREINHLPWVPAVKIMSDISMIMRNTPDEEIFNKYLLYLMDEVTNIESRGYDDWKTRLLLSPIACEIEHDECRKFAKKLFNKFLEHPTTDVFSHPDNVWIICNGLRDANETIWELLIESMNGEYLMISPYDYLKCSDSEEIRNKYMNQILTTNITEEPYEILSIFHHFLQGNRKDVDYALKYFIDHYELFEKNLEEKHNSQYMAVIFETFNDAVRNRDQYEKYKAFLESKLETLKEKSDEPELYTMPKDIEDGVKFTEKLSAKFHELMDKRLFGPNKIKFSDYID